MLVGSENSFPSESISLTALLDKTVLTRYGPSQFGLNFPLGSKTFCLACFSTQSPAFTLLCFTFLLKALTNRAWYSCVWYSGLILWLSKVVRLSCLCWAHCISISSNSIVTHSDLISTSIRSTALDSYTSEKGVAPVKFLVIVRYPYKVYSSLSAQSQ